jgi:hypothetical protein
VTFEQYTSPHRLVLNVGRRRTRQAASTVRELEGSYALLEAKRPSMARCGWPAADGPLRMARGPLAGKAVAGIVDAVDREHREVVTTNRARRRATGRAIARSFWGDGGATVG